MNNKNSVYQWIAVIFLALFFVAVFVAFLERARHRQKELLVIWGQTASNLGENLVDCRLWLFDPETQQASTPIIQEKRWCGYGVVYVDGKQRLSEIIPDGQIVLYNITSQQTIEVWQTIDLKTQVMGSPPQWGQDGSIYFSGEWGEDGQEQIYRFDSQTGTTTSFILFEPGLAADPLIAPDGNYLVYWTLDGPINRLPTVCGLGCVGYYHIYNLQTQADVELFPLLAPLVEEPLPHCSAQWAPTGRYLAFNIGGCGDWGARDLVVFDADESRIVALFEAAAEEVNFIFEGWFSNSELVYQRKQRSPELGSWVDTFWVYSLEEKASRELVESPAASEQLSRTQNLDWTPDSRFILGTNYAATPPSLIIVDASQESQRIDYFSYEDDFSNKPRWLPFRRPQLSPSGDWIAYYTSFREREEEGGSITNVYIVNRVSKDVVDLNTTNIERNLNYVWVQGQ
jgi:Tol biopolymer transport system component